MRRFIGAAAFTLILVLLSGCGGEGTGPTSPPPPPPPPPPAPVATVEVTATASSIVVGQSTTLTATARSATGAALNGRTVVWTSGAEAVATVSAAGVVTAVSPGLASITATIEGQSGSAAITVVPPEPASCRNCLEVVPATALVVPAGPGPAPAAADFDPAAIRLTVFEVDGSGTRTVVAATFESSSPAVGVSAAGVATATSVGSATVVARFGGRTSAPVPILAATPVAGTTLVSDEQVVGPPVPVDSTKAYGLGYRYRVRLQRASPTVGGVVLGTGQAPVGGRVVSVAPAGTDLSDVVLEVVALNQMFAALSMTEELPIDPGASVVPAGVAAVFDIQDLPGGGWRYRARSHQLARLVPVSSPTAAPNEFEFGLGPFECKAVVEGAVTFPMVLDGLSFDLFPSLALDVAVTNGRLERLAVRGSVTERLTSEMTLNAAVQGDVTCKYHVRTLILPIGGPLALLVGGSIPLGVGFKVEAKAELPGLGYEAFHQAQIAAEFGVDCTAACEVLHQFDATSSGSFKPRLPASLDEVRVEVGMGLFGYAELQLGNPFLAALQFKLVEVRAGLRQKADLAGERVQAADPAYASSFGLAPFLEAKTGSSLAALGGLLNITLAEFSAAPDLPALGRSPAGRLTISPAAVRAGGAGIGEPATFTVTLDPVDYLGAYAVAGVEIREVRDDGAGSITLLPGPPLCAALTGVPGQTEFGCAAAFPDTAVGTHRFAAFVRAELFGILLPVPLEVEANGVAGLTVLDSSGTGGGGGGCGEVFLGGDRRPSELVNVREVTRNLRIVQTADTSTAPIILPCLQRIGGLSIANLSSRALVLPNLTSVTDGGIQLSESPLIEVSMPSLQSVESFIVINGSSLTHLTLGPARLQGFVLAQAPRLTSLDNVAGLTLEPRNDLVRTFFVSVRTTGLTETGALSLVNRSTVVRGRVCTDAGPGGAEKCYTGPPYNP